jgi:hypothetical protein
MEKIKDYINALPLIILLVLIVGAGYFLFSQDSSPDQITGERSEALLKSK